jgi:hypothetical protein
MFHSFADPPLASITDLFTQMGLPLVISACVAVAIFWFISHRWGPMLQRIVTIVDREMGQAQRSAEALQQSAQSQMKRAYRQAAAVRSALDGVKSLYSLTTEIEQHARDLRQIAHRMAAESSSYGPASGEVARYAVSSADHLAETAERAKHTYRKLLTSVNQIVADSDGLREGEEVERQVRELTGAVERVRLAMPEHRGMPAKRPRTHPPRDERSVEGARRSALHDSRPGSRGHDDLDLPPRRSESEREYHARHDERSDRPLARSQPSGDGFAPDRGERRVTHGASRSREDFAPADAEWEQGERSNRRSTRSRDSERWDPDDIPPFEAPRRSPHGNRRSQREDDQRWRRG